MSGAAAFCHKCGTQLPAGATFCPRCGASVSSVTQQPGAQQPPTSRRGEKGEKHEKQEKQEKHEKNEKGEKGGGGDVLGAVVGGLILIWLGATFYLEESGYLPGDIWWAYFLSGVGAIVILQGAVIYSRGRRGLGSVVGGGIAAFIGLTTIAAHEYGFQARVWPLLIVALGLFVLLAGIASRRRVPSP